MEPVSLLLASSITDPVVVRPQAIGGRIVWESLVTTGVLRQVYDDGAVASDTAITVEVRVQAAAHLVTGNAVIAGLLAAWVWLGGDPPPLELTYCEGLGRPKAPPGSQVWSSTGLTANTITVGTIPVTSPHRTAIDVALKHPLAAPPILRGLAGIGVDLAAALLSLERRYRAVGRDHAREAFRAALTSGIL